MTVFACVPALCQKTADPYCDVYVAAPDWADRCKATLEPPDRVRLSEEFAGLAEHVTQLTRLIKVSSGDKPEILYVDAALAGEQQLGRLAKTRAEHLVVMATTNYGFARLVEMQRAVGGRATKVLPDAESCGDDIEKAIHTRLLWNLPESCETLPGAGYEAGRHANKHR